MDLIPAITDEDMFAMIVKDDVIGSTDDVVFSIMLYKHGFVEVDKTHYLWDNRYSSVVLKKFAVLGRFGRATKHGIQKPGSRIMLKFPEKYKFE